MSDKKYCFDQINNTLKVGDWVAYARKSGHTAGSINFGTVAEIYPETNQVKVRNDDTGRCSSNLRDGKQVLNTQILKDEHQELFI
jgi:hypothetical protein